MRLKNYNFHAYLRIKKVFVLCFINMSNTKKLAITGAIKAIAATMFGYSYENWFLETPKDWLFS